MIAVLIFFLILSFLVLIHEWGHYISAKMMGVRVEEFGFGYPPRLKTLFSRKGTEFTLNLLPFGGFVKLAGDDAESFEKVGHPSSQHEKTHGLFYQQSKRARLFIIYAGAAMNMIFGVVAFGAIYTVVGIPAPLARPKIDLIQQRSPAEQAGFVLGDELVSISGESVATSQEFIAKVNAHRGETVFIDVVREGVDQTISAYVRTKEETPVGEGGLGVAVVDTQLMRYPWWQMPFLGMKQGVEDSIAFSKLILAALRDMAVGAVTRGELSDTVSGPIGIVHTVQKEKVFERGPLAVLNFAALISINLGIMNVLPIPALDGGRGAFIFLETLIGRKRRAWLEQHANSVGMMLLFGFIIVVSIKDIFGIFKEW